ncbi:UNVERIFIED_CONTAM: ABC-type spermidine/putrescine transport system permease subunit I [Brevibacillus sp. OAP136]
MIGIEKSAPLPARESKPFAHLLARIPGLHWLLVIVPFVFMAGLTFFSMGKLFLLSVMDKKAGFSLEHLIAVFSNPVYLQVIWLTFKISFLVTVFSLFFAYPVAYLLVRMVSEKWKKVILASVLIPFWISLLVRTYAWTILLQDQGVINKVLISIGVIDEPIHLLYNTTGVVIGMTHVLLPYMVLSLYSVMQGIDQRLLQAAEGLGARPVQTFLQVFFPLSLPGVLSGSLLVFVFGLGFFVTPALLGGAETTMISMLIQDNINVTLNWHLASALSLVLFCITMLLLFIGYLFVRNHSALKDVT